MCSISHELGKEYICMLTVCLACGALYISLQMHGGIMRCSQSLDGVVDMLTEIHVKSL